jgi:hypothetical protein
VLVSLMGSSILSEVDNTSISGRGSQTRQRFPLSWLPVSRLLPPRSGLERSDFVRWRKAVVQEPRDRNKAEVFEYDDRLWRRWRIGHMWLAVVWG